MEKVRLLLLRFFDLHAHFDGDEQGATAEYVAKLLLDHEITTIREPGSFNGLDWALVHQPTSYWLGSMRPVSRAWALPPPQVRKS